MHLQNQECVIKTFHHHPATFTLRILKRMIVSLPFFLVASFFNGVADSTQLSFIYLAIFVFFTLLIVYDVYFFYLDRLVITNKRIVHIDWKGAFQRTENEAELLDIQDISTQEAGILSFIPFFDFGIFKLETASTRTTITFLDAPDPEGIKHFIYHLMTKPHTILTDHQNFSHDPAPKTSNKKTPVSDYVAE